MQGVNSVLINHCEVPGKSVRNKFTRKMHLP